MIVGFLNPIQTRQTMITKQFASAILFLIYVTACNTNNTTNIASNKTNDSVAVYTFKISNGFGYCIFIDDKEFIRQDCIPVIQGNKNFISESEAKKAGELVAQKIKQKQLPSLTLNDLKTLHITCN